MSDVVLTVGADAAEFWQQMNRVEQQSQGTGRKLDDAFGSAGRKLDGMTENARRFVGSLSSAAGLATGLLGSLAVVAGLVGGAVVVYDQLANASERAAAAAKEELSARRDALQTVRETMEHERILSGGGLPAVHLGAAEESQARRDQLAEQLKINELLERQAEVEQRIARLRQMISGFSPQDREIELRANEDLFERQRDINAQIAEYSAAIQDINRYEQERVDRARAQTSLQGEIEERRIVAELLAAEGESLAAREYQEQTNHIERMRRIAELNALGYHGAENLGRLEDERHRRALEQMREQEAERERAEEMRAEQERRRIEQEKAHAALSMRSLEADILALRGEDEAARRLRIQLDLERAILEVKRDQNLTDEQRARAIALLNERAALRLDQAPGGGSPSFRTLQGGFLGAPQLSGRALGAESPEARLTRESRERGEKMLARLQEILGEVRDVRRDGLPAVLN